MSSKSGKTVPDRGCSNRFPIGTCALRMLGHSPFSLHVVATSDLPAQVQPHHFLELKCSHCIFQTPNPSPSYTKYKLNSNVTLEIQIWNIKTPCSFFSRTTTTYRNSPALKPHHQNPRGWAWRCLLPRACADGFRRCDVERSDVPSAPAGFLRSA